jgi:2-oxoisovalerate dehydrogenase E2 component (dihydrolipoyl transacylase)
VAEDQSLADVMTDKASVEIPSPVTGLVQELGGAIGQVLAVGSVLVRIDSGGGSAVGTQDATPVAAAASRPLSTPTAAAPASPDVPTPPLAGPTPPLAVQTPPPPTSSGPLAAPAVRARAQALGIDLATVTGTGPDGRILHADLDALAVRASSGAHATPRAPATAPAQGTREIKLIGLRRAIAQKMLQSKRSIPHFTYVEEIDVTEMVALREALNRQYAQSRGELSPLALAIRAIVRAVADFPQVNGRFDESGDGAGVLTLYDAVHLGVATQTDGGLMVPVLRHAQTHWTCGAARSQVIVRLAATARAAAKPRATNCRVPRSPITSLGKLGGIVSTPVINHPEVAIVGINRIVERPMVYHAVPCRCGR